MRIRKNRKLSSINPSKMLQTNDCKLNQSPWDAVSFSGQTSDQSDPLRQFYRDVRSSPDERLDAEIGEVQSDALSIQRRDNSVPAEIRRASKEITENRSESMQVEEIRRCIRNDGKGWQCKKEPRRGQSFCDHHLKYLQSKNNTMHCERITTRASRRGSTSACKSDDFYYYTGFGPFRSKDRSERRGGGGGGAGAGGVVGVVGGEGQGGDEGEGGGGCADGSGDGGRGEGGGEGRGGGGGGEGECGAQGEGGSSGAGEGEGAERVSGGERGGGDENKEKNDEVVDDNGNKNDTSTRKRKRKQAKPVSSFPACLKNDKLN